MPPLGIIIQENISLWLNACVYFLQQSRAKDERREWSVSILNIISKAGLFTNGIEAERESIKSSLYNYISIYPMVFFLCYNSAYCLYCVIQLKKKSDTNQLSLKSYFPNFWK